MASFARSFKHSPAYLSPRRRPSMPGRSFSNSSDLSATSTADDSADVQVSSAPGTPSAEVPKNAPPPPNASRSGNSGPIAIELPKLKKINAAAAVYTPPEPLSARGDLPGGYFPMHEDPKGRVHRPHPFHQDAAFSRRHLHPDMAATHHYRNESHAPASTIMTHGSMPVSSYLAPGFHDSPLPMGKYYPSNYEQHQRSRSNRRGHPSASESLPSSMRHDMQPSRHDAHGDRYAPQTLRGGEAAEADARRKMQQYQRDMIAQAALALGKSKAASTAAPGASIGSKPLKDLWHMGPSPHKPASPRLHPLGSPGPVTPMDLEAASTGGYLEHGSKPQKLLLSHETMAAGSSRHATRSI